MGLVAYLALVSNIPMSPYPPLHCIRDQSPLSNLKSYMPLRTILGLGYLLTSLSLVSVVVNSVCRSTLILLLLHYWHHRLLPRFRLIVAVGTSCQLMLKRTVIQYPCWELWSSSVYICRCYCRSVSVSDTMSFRYAFRRNAHTLFLVSISYYSQLLVDIEKLIPVFQNVRALIHPASC